MPRDYEPIARDVRTRLAADATATARMQAVVDAVWEHLGNRRAPVSWVGFYLPNADGSELVLGPRRDKLACSPIGLHGMCGKSFTTRRPVVVDDVATLGENYVACDPRDRSEVVVPLMDADGACVAVLDLDSHDTGAFDHSDIEGLQQVLAAAGLSPA
ncbi:MAG: GAF domain-containing protein [Planctomycetes bacterium]|nr:GAF domain-containing protein [Planctomycetota bacterium]